MGTLFEIINTIFSLLANLFTLIPDAAAGGLLALVNDMFPDIIDKVLQDSFFTSMYSMMIPIGIALCALYVGFDILEKTTLQHFNLEMLILSITKIVVGVGFVSNGIAVFRGLNAVSARLAEMVISSGFFTSRVALSAAGDGTFSDPLQSTWALIIAIIQLVNPVNFINMLINLAIILIMFVFVPVAAYQRAVKIGIYCLLSPIIMADAAGNGLSHTRVIKFVFRLLTIFAEFPIVIIAIGLVESLYGAQQGVGMFIIFILFIQALFKSKDWVDSLFG